MDNNNGKYFVGNIKENLKENGWFFGHFANNPLLKSNDVEIAWQNISGKNVEPSDRHTHKKAVEINIIISGKMKLTINDESVTVNAGEFYVVWPDTIVDKVEADKDTVNLCIKAPSIPGDKYYL